MPVISIDDQNQIQNPVVKKNRMHNYSGKNLTNNPKPFKRTSLALKDGIMDKIEVVKASSGKELCEIDVFDDSVQPVK